MAEEQDREGMQSAPVGPCSKMYTAAVTSFVLQLPLWTLLGAREGPNPLKGVCRGLLLQCCSQQVCVSFPHSGVTVGLSAVSQC